MAVNLCGNYDEVFKFKEWGSANAHIMLMRETLEYVEERLSEGRTIASIEYDASHHSYYAFRITYV